MPFANLQEMEHTVPTFGTLAEQNYRNIDRDQIRAIVKEAHGRFVVVKCICRENARLKDRPFR
jgi:hypothetical protein